MRLPFEAEAFAEFEDAAARYEPERHGYGALFVSEVRQACPRPPTFPAVAPGHRAPIPPVTFGASWSADFRTC
jgi:hypothetical protein